MHALHVPDGYMSPLVGIAAYAIMAVVWSNSSRRLGRTLASRFIPALALLSVVSFLAMMYNIPIPGGMTAHAVGGVLLAITLGPHAAVLGVSIALLFQALFFADGGVLMFGVNAFNLAFAGPVIAWGLYKFLTKAMGEPALMSPKRLVAAGLAGYVGINISGLLTAVQMGIQPILFTDSSGAPLYSPYSMTQAVTAIGLAHLTVAGVAEAILTVAGFAFIARTNPGLLRSTHPMDEATSAYSPRTLVTGVVMGLIILLTPLGLLAPGGAFGEDAPEDLPLSELGLDAVPAGMAQYTSFWDFSLLDDYGFHGGGNDVVAYLLSALIGLAIVGLGVYILMTLVMWATNRESDFEEFDASERAAANNLPMEDSIAEMAGLASDSSTTSD